MLKASCVVIKKERWYFFYFYIILYFVVINIHLSTIHVCMYVWQINVSCSLVSLGFISSTALQDSANLKIHVMPQTQNIIIYSLSLSLKYCIATSKVA